MPVITSDIDGMRELVEDGKTGLLFKMRDSKDLYLYKKRTHLVDDPSELERMGKQIKSMKTTRENAIEMENIYDNLMKKKAGKASTLTQKSVLPISRELGL